VDPIPPGERFVSIIDEAVTWLTDGDHWSGRFGITARLWEHTRYSVSALVVAAAIALPPAIWAGHQRRWRGVVSNIANLGLVIPSLGILYFSVELFGIGELPFAGPIATFIVLIAMALPAIATNSYTGIAEVSDELRDAARGSGMTSAQRLWIVEVPVALPTLIAGLRIATVQVVATATLGALVGGGGLGRFIIDGFQTRDYPQVVAGALLVAAVALAAQLVFVVVTYLADRQYGVTNGPHGESLAAAITPGVSA
jgi:osmoprotectant transport system permease protein